MSRPLRQLTKHSITDPAELARELIEIRQSGLAYDREEAAPGVSCIAAPVVVRGEAVAALWLTLPAKEIRTAGLAPALRAVSLALARAFTPTHAG